MSHGKGVIHNSKNSVKKLRRIIDACLNCKLPMKECNGNCSLRKLLKQEEGGRDEEKTK